MKVRADAPSAPSQPVVGGRIFIPSPQQVEVFGFVKDGHGNAVLEAVAGAGKTTTLVEICKLLTGYVVFAAYNKKIADEIGRKLEAAGLDTRRIQAKTFHSIGFGAWRKVAPGVKLNERKVANIMESESVPRGLRAFVGTLVSLAKQRALGVERMEDMFDFDPWDAIVAHFALDEKLDGLVGKEADSAIEQGISLAQQVYQVSIQADTEEIDFDDMILAPLLHEARFFQFDWFLGDEMQDTNPARRLLARRALKPGGRIIAVGDRHQAIYGFAGADNDALDTIADTFGCTRLPLTITYRCPKAVVAHARQWVGHIEAHESAPEGVVRTISDEEFKAIPLEVTDAVLCRNTRPLVQLAFDLIRRHIPCHVEGRDIGQNLLALATKWQGAKTMRGLRTKLRDYYDRETDRLLEKGREAQVAALTDKVDTLYVLMDSFPDDEPVTSLRRLIESLFQDSDGNQRPSVTLSTVHKSKGREWKRVYLLGRNRFMPSPWATQGWALEQEKNLIYVAVTRAMEELIEVTVTA